MAHAHIDFVHEKRHMNVSLETPIPPPHPLRNITHSYRYFVLNHFLRSAIGDAFARNMSSSADICFLLIYMNLKISKVS